MQARDRWAESELRKEGSAGAGNLQTITGGAAPGASRRGHAAPPRIRTGQRPTGGRHAVAVRTAVGADVRKDTEAADGRRRRWEAEPFHWLPPHTGADGQPSRWSVLRRRRAICAEAAAASGSRAGQPD
eukprot:scaffold4294_cov107-Isochrysis_galbana.AAC.1